MDGPFTHMDVVVVDDGVIVIGVVDVAGVTTRNNNTNNNNNKNSNNSDSNIHIVVPYTKGLSEGFKNICGKWGTSPL